MTNSEHPARALPQAQRIDYLTVVASLVAADGHVDDQELARLRELCAALDAPTDAEAQVLAGARAPDGARVRELLAQASHALRVSLLGDAIAIAFADGKLAADEVKAIGEMARALEVAPAQAMMIGRYVESLHTGDGRDAGLAHELAAALGDASPSWLSRIFRKKRS